MRYQIKTKNAEYASYRIVGRLSGGISVAYVRSDDSTYGVAPWGSSHRGVKQEEVYDRINDGDIVSCVPLA